MKKYSTPFDNGILRYNLAKKRTGCIRGKQ
jgi:hypothetical protein